MENYQYLLSITKLGVNRFSIGVQSFNDFELKQLGRIHTVEDSIELFKLIHKTNTNNISFDLILGLPGQRKKDWIRPSGIKKNKSKKFWNIDIGFKYLLIFPEKIE